MKPRVPGPVAVFSRTARRRANNVSFLSGPEQLAEQGNRVFSVSFSHTSTSFWLKNCRGWNDGIIFLLNQRNIQMNAASTFSGVLHLHFAVWSRSKLDGSLYVESAEENLYLVVFNRTWIQFPKFLFMNFLEWDEKEQVKPFLLPTFLEVLSFLD